jgi:CheY-like chemotaxis protein
VLPQAARPFVFRVCFSVAPQRRIEALMHETARTILLVDDEPLMREVAALLLEEAGFVVVQAANGAEAIEWLRTFRPSLVLLDLVMPRVNGWGVLAYIRTLNVPMPVVIVTGMGEVVPPGDLGRLVAGHLLKPFTLERLFRTCYTALSAPPLIPASRRREQRRTFAVHATVSTEDGVPMTHGQLLQVSLHGFRIETEDPIPPGEPVRVDFPVPGYRRPMRLWGRVRWQNQNVAGAEIDGLQSQEQQLLRELVRVV